MKLTIILTLICILATFYFWFSNPESLVEELGFSLENLEKGKYWVLLTSIFIHSSFDHLISNIFALLLFGYALEKVVRKKVYLLLFFSGALAGDVFCFLFYGKEQLAIGASAAIFSIMSAALILEPVIIEFYILPIPIAIYAIGYLLYLFVGILTNTPQNVAHFSHLGGALVGLSYAFYKKGVKNGLRILLIAFLLFFLLSFVKLIY